MSQGVYVIREHLAAAKQAIKSFRIHLKGTEGWLDGDDMVSVQQVWDRDKLEQYVEHLGQLEDTYAGLLVLCEELE